MDYSFIVIVLNIWLVFSGTFFPSSTSGLVADLALSPLCEFHAKTDKEIVWVVPVQTKGDPLGTVPEIKVRPYY